MKSHKAIILATTLASIYACTPVWADTGAAPRSVTVHFEDLNINSARGAAQLYQRIRFAAEDICGRNLVQRSLTLESLYTTCVRGAIGGAVARVPAATPALVTDCNRCGWSHQSLQ